MKEEAQDGKTVVDKRKRKASRRSAELKLSCPWGLHQTQEARNMDKAFYSNFISERTRVHETYIREQARNKRIGLILSFLLIIAASTIILFAPKGRETLSYWIGAALVIFAAGSVGFSRVLGKAANVSFGADQDKRSVNK